MKKIFVCICTLSIMGLGGYAQELNKEITLEKDFVPVEKKATKKNALPVVIQPAKNETPTTLKYSDWAQPTAVATSIPTMLPYGYRTSHIFSDKRGYFDFGIGSQLNMVGSTGYRLVDDEHTKLSLWLQHNSSWSGKNTSPLAIDDHKLKQKFNDNVLGIDLNHRFSKGLLDAGGSLHFDNFNYYGGDTDTHLDVEPGISPDFVFPYTCTTGYNWDDDKQTFIDAKLRGRWNSRITIADHDFDYHVAMRYNFARYSKSFTRDFDGAREHHFNAGLGAFYQFTGAAGVGGDVNVDYLNRAQNGYTDAMTIITLRPFYRYEGERASASLGVNLNFSFSDGAKIRLAPHVAIDYKFAPGAALYATAMGGKRLNTLSSMAAINRYSDPLGGYENSFVPIDAEAGFKVGPFRGFSFKIYGGYGIVKDNPLVVAPLDLAHTPADNFYKSFALYYHNPSMVIDRSQFFAPVFFRSYNTRGVKFGAEVNYKYRSLAELDVKAVFAPQSRDLDGKYIKGYSLGLDRAKVVLNADVKVNPIRALTLNVGFDYRGGRYNIADYHIAFNQGELGLGNVIHSINSTTAYDLADVLNLRAGASYRFDKTLTLWVQASNLLNKQWDVTMGMGAQKLGFMGGLQLVF